MLKLENQDDIVMSLAANREHRWVGEHIENEADGNLVLVIEAGAGYWPALINGLQHVH